MAESYGNPTWRADVSLPNGIPSHPAKELHLDFTITNPFVKTQLSKAGKASDSATLHGEQHKNNAIGKHLPPTSHLLPVSLSVLGAVGEASRPLYNFVLTQLAYQTNAPFAEVATTFWITQSVLIQRLKALTIFKVLLTLERTRTPKPSDIHSGQSYIDLTAAFS